jgi:histidyl-tRNA synthetase
MPAFKTLKGFKDLLPEESFIWESLASIARNLFDLYGFSMIQTPILEPSDLFTQSIGTTTDIIEKEMYTFEDRDKSKISLRPEGTASVVRAYLEHPTLSQQPYTKLYYMGPMFRHERPQAGRLRQFHQIGAESIGEINPNRDIEMLALLVHLFEQWKIADLTLEINSLGCPACRPPYRQQLVHFLTDAIHALCEDCARRLHTNPLRILDCKKEGCRTHTRHAPSSRDCLCSECDIHFKTVEEGLHQLNIPYIVNRHLVRGIDYYTKTAFELTTTALGAQNAVAAGGRYDSLIKTLGGPQVPAIGFAIGLERVAKLINPEAIQPHPLTLFIIPLGEAAHTLLFPILYSFRRNKVKSELGDRNMNLKRQLKQADHFKARYVLIVGDEELGGEYGVLRNMATREQQKIPLTTIVESAIAQIAPKINHSLYSL